MDFIDNAFSGSSFRYLFIALIFVVLFIVLVMIYNYIIKKWRERARASKSVIDDFIVRLFRVPGIWIIFSVLLHLFSSFLKEDEATFATFEKISRIMLILTIGWLLIQVVRGLFHYWQKRFDITTSNNLEARKRLTQMSMIERIVIIAIAFIFVAIALMSIESVRQLGVSLLASAGVAGIVIGFAAQRSFGKCSRASKCLHATH